MLPHFSPLPKLQPGDKVAVLSPSFAAPGKWPHMYELGCQRLRSVFQLEPVAFPYTAKVGATGEERSTDLIAAFEDKNIRAVVASLGGNDQITYVKNLPTEPFTNNPKPFFGFSDNTHFCHHLWMLGIPSYYGASLLTQFAMQGAMDAYTIHYLQKAFFEGGRVALQAAETYNDKGLNWEDPDNLTKYREHVANSGWYWSGENNAEGILWGGCLESLDEILRHHITLPTLKAAEEIIFFFETSEEMPTHENVRRVLRAFGELGYLERFQGFLVGRPQTWTFEHPTPPAEQERWKAKQRDTVEAIIRAYNTTAPIIQNMDFGHTNPQICLPMGKLATIDGGSKKISVDFS